LRLPALNKLEFQETEKFLPARSTTAMGFWFSGLFCWHGDVYKGKRLLPPWGWNIYYITSLFGTAGQWVCAAGNLIASNYSELIPI
jgi:hypothetical protein